MRRCIECGIEKSLTEFHKHSRYLDGYHIRCIECGKKRKKVVDCSEYWKKSQADSFVVKYCDTCGGKIPTSVNRCSDCTLILDPSVLGDRKKVEDIFRSRVMRMVIKKITNESITMLVGCSVEEARRYIEGKFYGGMRWEDHGVKGWHLDHVIPCSAYNLLNSVELKQCFHYSNLQPLWWVDNCRKSDYCGGRRSSVVNSCT